MHVVHHHRDHRGLVRRRAEDAQARHRGEARLGVGEQVALVRGDRVEAEPLDVVDRGAEADDRRRCRVCRPRSAAGSPRRSCPKRHRLRSSSRRSGTAASPRAARRGPRARRRPTGRTACGPRTRRNRSRARARRRAGAAPPARRRRAAARRARGTARDLARSGSRCRARSRRASRAASCVRGESSFSNSSSSSTPRSSIGATRSTRTALLAQHLPGHEVRVVLHVR